MFFLLTFGSGRTAEGVLLAAARERLRIAVVGRSDTIELTRVDGVWRGDDGETVEIEAVTAVEGFDCAELAANLAPRRMGAGARAC